MFTATVKTTKTKIISYLCVALAVIIGAILFFGGRSAEKPPLPKGANIAQVQEFLASRGIETAGEVNKEQITLPKDFDETLTEYNEKLETAGWNLKPYLGKTLSLYVFSLKGETEVYAKIYTFEGEIIAAEISNHITGEQKPIDEVD